MVLLRLRLADFLGELVKDAFDTIPVFPGRNYASEEDIRSRTFCKPKDERRCASHSGLNQNAIPRASLGGVWYNARQVKYSFSPA